jgi:hypothetical protein
LVWLISNIVEMFGHSDLGHWDTLKRMKICKPSFTSPNVCMWKWWIWHGITYIMNYSRIKQSKNEKLVQSSISMNLRWIVDGVPSYPPISFYKNKKWFKVFWNFNAKCGLLLNTNFVKPIKMNSWWLWFVYNWSITTPIPTSMQKMWQKWQ